MRTWRKTLGMVAGGLVGLGGCIASAAAQYPSAGGMPPGMGMPPGAGMPMQPSAGMPPYMGMPPGMGMPGAGMPQGMQLPQAGGMEMPQGGGMGPGAFCPTPGGPPADFPNNAQPSQEPASPFSLKEEGMPNAFSELCDPRALRPLRFQISLGYSMMWFRPSNFPPLVTTGSQADPIPGALGQPNTQILAGGQRDPGLSSAFKTTLTYWLIDPESLCVQGTFFIMEQRSLPMSYNSDPNGFPVLARPFFDPTIGNQNSDPRSIPGVLSGSAADTVTTRLMGGDLNLKWHSAAYSEGAHFAFLLGMRWLQLDERYLSNDTTQNIPAGGFVTTISDNFSTYNRFFGGQIGAEYQYKAGRFTFDFAGKLAVGPNYENLKISGQTSNTEVATGITTTDFSRGLFAQASNSGNYHTIRIAVLPELTARMNFDITEHLRFHVGYTFLLINNTVRPGEQIDRVINIQPLGIGQGLLPLSPGPAVFRQTTFSANVIDLGLEFCF